MLEKLLKICETEPMEGSFRKVSVESLNEEGEFFIEKHGSTFMGKYFNIHNDDKESEICEAISELVFSSEVKHQNIVSNLGYFFCDGQLILIYEEPEYTLESSLPEDISEFLETTEQIMEAISHLHSLRIVHGDIQISNFSVYKNGKIKLLFSGKSIIIPSDFHTEVDIMMYEMKYRPIECFYNECGFTSDIWALGCTMFKLLYKTDLFPEQNSLNEYITCLESWKNNSKNESGKCIKIPDEWSKIENFNINYLILRILNSNKEKRPSIFEVKDNLKEIKNELNNFISSSPNTPTFIFEEMKFNEVPFVIRTINYDMNSIPKKIRRNIISRSNGKSEKFISIVAACYENICSSSEFDNDSFELSLNIANILTGRKVECELSNILESKFLSLDDLFSN